MEELLEVKKATNPTEILLTVDSMIGQESVNVASTFNEKLDITGVILTKLDGSSKGGVVFAIAKKYGIPIKYVGVGEGVDDIEPFDPQDFVDNII